MDIDNSVNIKERLPKSCLLVLAMVIEGIVSGFGEIAIQKINYEKLSFFELSS